MTFDISQKKITIIGAKRSGLALARLIVHYGGLARLSDQSSDNELDEEFLCWADKNYVEMEWGGNTVDFIQSSDIVVLSPGVPFNALPIQWAREKNIPVVGEIEFAFQFCACPIIAITGSNGKTTTVNLIHQVLLVSGLKSCLCGNIGTPFSEHVLKLADYDYFVLEVSSFQMEVLLPKDDRSGLKKFKPKIAGILNFSQNHLDRHKDMDDYFQAKAKIFQNQDEDDFAVLNDQDERLQQLSHQLRGNIVSFNKDENNSWNPNQKAVGAVAKILNISSDVCSSVFEKFQGVEHRMEIVRVIDGVTFINDSKATTVESGRWALEQMEQKVIMICGGRDKQLDYSVIKDLVAKKVKKMFIIGEAQAKIQATYQDIVDVELVGDLKSAIELSKRMAIKDDHILFSPMCASFDMFLNYEDRGKKYKEMVHELKACSYA